jgi:hypothetical protein
MSISGSFRRTAACMVLAGLLLASCGDGGGDEGATPAGQPKSTNQSFDIFLGDKLGLVEFAVQKIRNKCLAKAGYPQNLNGMMSAPKRTFPNLVITERRFGPTSEADAKRLGFGKDAAAQPARVVSFDPSYDKSFAKCEKEAKAAIGSDVQRVMDAYIELGNKLQAEFTAAVLKGIAEAKPKAHQELLDCMTAKKFVPSDAAAFLEEPDPKLFGVPFGDLENGGDSWEPQRKKGTVQVGPPVAAIRYVPTAQESALAVAWFQCRRSTGLSAALIEVASEVQTEIVARHEVQFEELNPQLLEMSRKALTQVGG